MAQVGYTIDPAKLTYWRKRRRLSQRSLAEMIGKSEGFVRALEKERRRPGIETVGALERVLGCTAADLGVSEDELPGRPLADDEDESSANADHVGEALVAVAGFAGCAAGG